MPYMLLSANCRCMCSCFVSQCNRFIAYYCVFVYSLGVRLVCHLHLA